MSKERVIRQRMCIVCRKRGLKEEFLRIIKTYTGAFIIDETYKAPGRGAYICKNKECIENALNKKTLNRTFKCSVPDEIYEKLEKELTGKYNEQ